MDVTSLHKKLLPNWSAGTVSKSLSTPASLETVKTGFEKFETKSKMRVLLSLLNFDHKTKADCATHIKDLLRHAADKGDDGEWLSVIAGLVHARLLGGKECGVGENEAKAFYHLDGTAGKIVEQLSRKEEAAMAQHSLSFQPLELKFLSSASSVASSSSSSGSSSFSVTGQQDRQDAYSNSHFTYCGDVPDLITKASRSLEERVITDQKNKNMPAIGKNRDIYRNVQSEGGNSSYSSTMARKLPMAAGARSSSSSGQRQASKMLDQLDTGMQQRALSAALSGTQEAQSNTLKRKAPPDGGPAAKSKPKGEEKAEAAPDQNPPNPPPVAKKKEDGEEVKALPREKAPPVKEKPPPPPRQMKANAAAAVAAQFYGKNKDAASTSLPAEVEISKAPNPNPKPPVTEAKRATPEKIVKAVPVPAAVATIAPVAPVTVSVIIPVIAPPVSVPPPSVPPPSVPSSSSITTASMDIEALFLSFPLLTPKDRATIERFFADNWREHFPPSFTAETPVLKIKLRSDEKVDMGGQRTRETIYLHLEFNPHSWKKILKKNKISSKEAT